MKTQFVEIFNNENEYLGTLVKEVKNRPSFSIEINGGYSDCSLKLDNSYTTDSEILAPLNIVRWYIDDDKYTDPVLIYTGYIGEVNYTREASSEFVDVKLYAAHRQMYQLYYKNGTSYTVTQTSENVSDGIRDIIDYYQSINTNYLIDYDGTTLETNTGVSYTFDYEKRRCFEAIEDTIQFFDPDWYFYINSDGMVHVHEKSDEEDIILTVGKDVQVISPLKSAKGLINRQRVEYNGGNTTVDSTTSQTSYGILEGNVISDTNIGDLTSAALLATKVVTEGKDPVVTGEIEVNEAYSAGLETLKPGMMIRLANYTTEQELLDGLFTVAKVNYDFTKVSLELGKVRTSFLKSLRLFVNVQQ